MVNKSILLLILIGINWATPTFEIDNFENFLDIFNPNSSGGISSFEYDGIAHGSVLKISDQSESNLYGYGVETKALFPTSPTQSLSFDYRGSKKDQKVSIVIFQYDGEQNFISGNNKIYYFDTDLEWRRFTFTILRDALHPEAEFFKLKFLPVAVSEGEEQVGTAFLDNIIIEQLYSNAKTNEGYWISQDEGSGVSAWQSPAEQKILMEDTEPPMTNTRAGLEIFAAKGEVEAIQLVLASAVATANLTSIQFTDLVNSNGDVISKDSITTREVVYLNLNESYPSDVNAIRGFVPDPLPKIDHQNLDLKIRNPISGWNSLPIWLSVSVPRNIPAGVYTTTASLGFGHNATIKTISLNLTVWDFELPKFPKLKTAFDLNKTVVDQYHSLKNDVVKKSVYDKYLRDFAKHRVAPQTPFMSETLSYEYYITQTGNLPRARLANVKLPLPIWANLDVSDLSGVMQKDLGNISIVGEESGNSANKVLKLIKNKSNNLLTSTSLIKVTPNSDYKLKFDAKSLLGLTKNHSFALRYDVNKKKLASNITFEYAIANTLSPALKLDGSDIIFTTDSQTEYIKLQFYAVSYGNPNQAIDSIYIDDIELLNVSLPQTPITVFFEDFELKDTDLYQIDVSSTFSDNSGTRALFYFDELGFDHFRFNLPYFDQIHITGRNKYFNKIPAIDFGNDLHQQFVSGQLTSAKNEPGLINYWDRAYTYPHDEPKNEPDIIDLVVQGYSFFEGNIKTLLTAIKPYENEDLVEQTDIWVPISDAYNEEWSKERIASGDEMWWYVATGPKTPYSNLFMDKQGIEPRLLFWQTYQRGFTGLLYYRVNYYQTANNGLYRTAGGTYNDTTKICTTVEGVAYQGECHNPNGVYNHSNKVVDNDPWTNPSSRGTTQKHLFWSNGDGRLIYPPRDWHANHMKDIDGNSLTSSTALDEEPVPSIRWELIRDGSEDYDYLALLKEARDELQSLSSGHSLVLQANALLDLNDISPTLTSFTLSSEALHAKRKKIAELIVSINALISNGLGPNVLGFEEAAAWTLFGAHNSEITSEFAYSGSKSLKITPNASHYGGMKAEIFSAPLAAYEEGRLAINIKIYVPPSTLIGEWSDYIGNMQVLIGDNLGWSGQFDLGNLDVNESGWLNYQIILSDYDKQVLLNADIDNRNDFEKELGLPNTSSYLLGINWSGNVGPVYIDEIEFVSVPAENNDFVDCSQLVEWNESGWYTEGAIIKSAVKNNSLPGRFKCLEAEKCRIAGYEPENTDYWQQVWEKQGRCQEKVITSLASLAKDDEISIYSSKSGEYMGRFCEVNTEKILLSAEDRLHSGCDVFVVEEIDVSNNLLRLKAKHGPYGLIRTSIDEYSTFDVIVPTGTTQASAAFNAKLFLRTMFLGNGSGEVHLWGTEFNLQAYINNGGRIENGIEDLLIDDEKLGYDTPSARDGYLFADEQNKAVKFRDKSIGDSGELNWVIIKRNE